MNANNPVWLGTDVFIYHRTSLAKNLHRAKSFNYTVIETFGSIPNSWLVKSSDRWACMNELKHTPPTHYKWPTYCMEHTPTLDMCVLCVLYCRGLSKVVGWFLTEMLHEWILPTNYKWLTVVSTRLQDHRDSKIPQCPRNTWCSSEWNNKLCPILPNEDWGGMCVRITSWGA